MGGDDSFSDNQDPAQFRDSDHSDENQECDKLSVNLDDLPDGDDSDEQPPAKQSEEDKLKSLQYSSGSNRSNSTDSGLQNLFKVGSSNDKGLADMETGSEVYMSELLVSKASLTNCECRLALTWMTWTTQKKQMRMISLRSKIHLLKLKC